MLGNEEKRVIYDVYGLQGLQSGLEVGESLRNPSDLKKEFERFKAKQASWPSKYNCHARFPDCGTSLLLCQQVQ